MRNGRDVSWRFGLTLILLVMAGLDPAIHLGSSCPGLRLA